MNSAHRSRTYARQQGTLALCLAAVGLCVAAAAQDPAAAPNLLANDGFEQVAPDGWATGWLAWQRDPPEPGAVSIDPQVAFLGSHSLRLRHASDKSYTRGEQQLTVQPGRKYAFTVRVKGEGITCQEPGWGARLWIEGPNTPCSQALAGTFDWTTLTVGPVSFGQATTVTVMCYLYQARGTAWFDEVTAFEVTPEWEKLQQQVCCLDLLVRDVGLAREAAQQVGDEAGLQELARIQAAARREDMPTHLDWRTGPPYFPLHTQAGRDGAGERPPVPGRHTPGCLEHGPVCPNTASRVSAR